MTMKLMNEKRERAVRENIEDSEKAMLILNNYIREQMHAGVEPEHFFPMISALNTVDAILSSERILLEHGGNIVDFAHEMIEQMKGMPTGDKPTWARRNADIVYWIQSGKIVSIEEAVKIIFPMKEEGKLE
jgi:hypothetical protein